MRGRRNGPLTVAAIAETVAFEAGKSADEVLASSRRYDIWLRHVVIWIARHVGRAPMHEVAAGIGKGEWVTSNHARRADRRHADDAEFRRMTSIVASALVLS